MHPKPTLETIEPVTILDPQFLDRVIDFQHVAHLADSLAAVGQMQPIVVKRESNRIYYQIYDGAHLLRAAHQLEMSAIRALVFDETTDDDYIRRSILERDLLTREISWAIQCLEIQELKSLHEMCYPEMKVGQVERRKAWNKKIIPAFVAHVARERRAKKSKIRERLTLTDDLGTKTCHR